MKRSTLSVALLYAACGFAVTGAVMLPSSLVADNDQNAAVAANTVSTKTFDAVIKENEKTGKAELVVTNTTDQPQNVAWTVKVNSAGETNRMSRVPVMPKETFTQAHKAPLKAREAKTLTIDFPEAAKNEYRFVIVNIGEKNLPVPLKIEKPAELSLTN